MEKCVFGASSIQFLGHHFSAEGVEPLPAVTDFPRPSTVKELKMFLGIVNFYRRFLPGAARALTLLTDCLRGGPKGPTAVEWSGQDAGQFNIQKVRYSSVRCSIAQRVTPVAIVSLHRLLMGSFLAF